MIIGVVILAKGKVNNVCRVTAFASFENLGGRLEKEWSLTDGL